MATDINYDRRVEAGAALLDDAAPGWWTVGGGADALTGDRLPVIDLDDLDTASSTYDLLAQLWGDFDRAPRRLRQHNGFDIDDVWDFDLSVADEHAGLTEAWRKLIERRRAE